MRQVQIIGLTVVLFILVLSQWATADVPRSINYQGRITDSNGDPVTGDYTIEFRISDAPTLGLLLYNSGPQTVAVTNGLFRVNIGEPPMPELPISIFEDTNRYLSIKVGSDPEISPRTKITSVPYAYQVRTIDGATGGDVSGTVDFNSGASTRAQVSPSLSRITTYGSDDLEAVRLWGPSWGEVLLFDSDQTNDQTARLSSQVGLFQGGGALELNNSDGSPDISLYAGGTGNETVILPNSAISDLEIQDEPGVANNTSTSVQIEVTISNIAVRTINCPTSGYVLALASGSFDLTHVTGLIAQYTFWITDVSNGTSADMPKITFNHSGNSPTGTYSTPYAMQGIFSVSAGANSFYVRGSKGTGNGTLNLRDNDLTLVFFPTSYGTIVSHSPANPNQPEYLTAASDGEELSGDAFTAQRLAYEVAELKRQLAEVREKLQVTTQQEEVKE